MRSEFLTIFFGLMVLSNLVCSLIPQEGNVCQTQLCECDNSTINCRARNITELTKDFIIPQQVWLGRKGVQQINSQLAKLFLKENCNTQLTEA